MRGIAKGMATTFRHLLRPAITYGYPGVKRDLPERSRMSFALLTDEAGEPQCKSCLLCEKSCPDDAIKIESEKRTDGPGRVLTRFTVDLGRCMYCGLCVEQCSTSGLVQTGDYEVCSHERSDMMLVLYERGPASGDRARPADPDESDAMSAGSDEAVES